MKAQAAVIVCDLLLVLNNVLLLTAASAEAWLHDRAYFITGPREHERILDVVDFAFTGILVAFFLGILSLVCLHFARCDQPDVVSPRRKWAYVSLLASGVVFLVELYPIKQG